MRKPHCDVPTAWETSSDPRVMENPAQIALQQRREDIAGILWSLIYKRRAMRKMAATKSGFMQGAAWRSYDALTRQINLVREISNG
jgi:hypothetical protein